MQVGGLEDRRPSKESAFPPVVGDFAAYHGRKSSFVGQVQPAHAPLRKSY